MDIKELMDKGVAHIVKMMDGTGGEAWEGTAPMYEGVCGWCGVMSPMNRPAFVAKFGEDFTAKAEEKAREVLAGRKNFWENSKAKGYEAMADNAEGNDPASFEVGGFVWGCDSGLKCDHENLRETIREFYEYGGECSHQPKLCKIIRIEEVEDIQRDAATILKGWKPEENNEGGGGSDDVTDEEYGEFASLTDEQKRTFYTLAVLVRDTKGRYFLIDPEGYGYPRYIILPKRWEQIFEELCAEVKNEIEAEEIRRAAEKARAAAERKAAYDARCAKWNGLMEELPDNVKGHEYNPEYRKIGKRNIAKMAKTAFPWVRFSVSYDGGWGTGYVLKWKNGPTVDEVRKACDFGLFEPWRDTFDGMTDCAGSSSAEFTDFSEKYGGVGNGVTFKREECDHDNNGDPDKPTRKHEVAEDEGNAAEIANAEREIAEADNCVICGGNPDNGDPAKNEAYWRENKAKHGIEIYFPAVPSEGVRGDMKLNGWRYSKWNKCWYNRFNEGTWEKAREIVMCFNKNKVVA